MSGCECADGYARNGTMCIKQELCSCWDPYHNTTRDVCGYLNIYSICIFSSINYKIWCTLWSFLIKTLKLSMLIFIKIVFFRDITFYKWKVVRILSQHIFHVYQWWYIDTMLWFVYAYFHLPVQSVYCSIHVNHIVCDTFQPMEEWVQGCDKCRCLNNTIDCKLNCPPIDCPGVR